MMPLADIKENLRHGKYSWPGGYPLLFITCDGAALCFDCVRSEWRDIVSAHLDPGYSTGWEIAGLDANWEDPELYCDHCGDRIESAYAEPEE
jgi:hypothetical protein